jgi:hypothetical protein
VSNLLYDAPSEPLARNYSSLTTNVRALITSRWGKSGYRPRVVRNIETYYVDTSLDNDTDPWTLEIGDPRGEYLDTLKRDNEVRVQIFGVGSKASGIPLLTGFADDVEYGDDGTLRFTGRDFSSLAVDSAVPPNQYRHIQAWRLVQQQAREIGFTRTRLAKTGPTGPVIKKSQYTDGSETYWEFWYRLYRKERMWLWTEPEGTLVADKLNYTGAPRYHFGEPRTKDPKNIQRQYIPVEGFSIRKGTQSRIGEFWVYGHKGDNGVFSGPVFDPTTKGWVKRPRRIMMDSEAHSKREAIKTAWEEIFEGKVGALEYSIAIGDPGFPIDQNTICVLNLTDPDISGEFFVVGARSRLGPEGFIQEIRLRERQYAISRRVPADPKISKSTEVVRSNVEEFFPSAISDNSEAPQEWMPYFVKAANKYHGNWDYNLFLATLLAICDQETSFKNYRSYGGPGGDRIEWYQWRPTSGDIHAMHDAHGRTKMQWQEIFANEPGQFTGQNWAVGPMQLYTIGYKENADRAFSGRIDEYGGGRWHPEYNIMEAARVLIDKNQAANRNSGRDIDMWGGVSLYGHNAQLYSPGNPTPYAISVKNKVYNDPGYLKIVTGARSQAQQSSDTKYGPAGVGTSDPGDSNSPTSGFQNSGSFIRSLSHIQTAHSGVDIVHVDPELLTRLNRLAAGTGRTIVITSGFRSYAQQQAAWDKYVASGFNESYLAANPTKGSNHMIGRAVDATVGGVAIGNAISASTMAIYGIHNSVPPFGTRDKVHVALLTVSG